MVHLRLIIENESRVMAVDGQVGAALGGPGWAHSVRRPGFINMDERGNRSSKRSSRRVPRPAPRRRPLAAGRAGDL